MSVQGVKRKWCVVWPLPCAYFLKGMSWQSLISEGCSAFVLGLSPRVVLHNSVILKKI